MAGIVDQHVDSAKPLDGLPRRRRRWLTGCEGPGWPSSRSEPSLNASATFSVAARLPRHSVAVCQDGANEFVAEALEVPVINQTRLFMALSDHRNG